MKEEQNTSKTALVVGATGIVGLNLSCFLQTEGGWTVYGLARNPDLPYGIRPLTADLLDFSSVHQAIKRTAPTHVFISTWLRQATEAENVRVNGTMVRNLLSAIEAESSVQHVALVTGLKHYLGPFEAYGKGVLPATPFREEQGRLDVKNFYYAQEDELFAGAGRGGYSWSVHRPHTIIGYALGNAMNMPVTLAVYASICRATGMPFMFPGSSVQWNRLTDMTDAHLLARHLTWASTTDAGRNQAFNVVNGDVFRWSWMWHRIASWFGLQTAEFTGYVQPLEVQLQGAATTWRRISEQHSLREPDIDRLASAWHTDADLGRPIEVLADMSKSRKLGFREYQATDESFFNVFDRLRRERIIP